MSFREKKAWVTLAALVAVFLPFCLLMMDGFHRPDPDYFYLGNLVLGALGAFVLLECVLVLMARYLSPEDASVPPDERDQLFAFYASRFAYVALIALVVIVTFFLIHAHGRNWGWGMAYLLAIVLAEMLRATALIAQYRRG